MQKFSFDLQRFAITFEYTYGIKTIADPGVIGGGSTEYTYWDEERQCNVTGYKPYTIYQYYPASWNNYRQFQNFSAFGLIAINEYRYDSTDNGWQNWQATVLGSGIFSGDYRILRGGNAEYHALTNREADYVQMYGRNDNCVLKNEGGCYALLVGGTGDDYITNSNYKVTVDGLVFNQSAGFYVSIDGGAGNDYIENTGNYASINGGTGNDNIDNKGINVTINAGAGNDSVTVSGYHNEIHTATDNWLDDNDDFVLIMEGSLGNTIDTGWGNDTIDIKAAAIGNSINSGQGNDSIVNEASNITIHSGTSDDTIENYGEYTFIDSGDEYATVDKDSIKNSAANVTIKGCGGNDVIENWGRGVSIDAGAGDDVISLRANTPIDDVWKHLVNPLKTFAGDIVGAYFGFNPNEIKRDLDIITDETKPFNEKQAAAERITQAYSDNIREDKSGKIIMDNEAYRLLNSFKGKLGRLVSRYEVLKATGTLLDTYMNDKILSSFAKEASEGFAACFEKDSNGRWCFAWESAETERTTVRGGKGDDEFYNDEFAFHVYEYAAGDGNDVFHGWNLNDTLKITGGNYSTTRVGNDFVVLVGDGSITFKDYYSRGLLRTNTRWEYTPVEIEGISTSSGNNSGNATAPYVTPPEGISVDKNTVKADEGFSGAVDVSDGYSPNVTKIDAVNASSVVIFGNESVREIKSGSGDDKIHHGGSFSIIVSGAGKDSIFSEGDENTLDAGAGNDEIFSVGKKNLVNYRYGDGNDTIYGFDETSTLKLGDGTQTYSAAKSGNDLIVTVGDGSVVLKDAVNLSTVNISGKLIEDEPPVDEKLVQGTDKSEKLNNTVEGATIQAFGGSDTVTNSGNFVSIDGGEGNDKIVNTATGVTVTGSAGNDFITLSGGSNGGNIFVYSAGDGKDVVYKFQSTDTIKIADNSTPSPSIKGKDVILTFDKNNFITLKDAAAGLGKTVTLVNANGKIISAATYSTLGVAQDNSVKLASSFKGTISPDTFKTIDASDVSTLNLSLGGKKITDVEVDGKTINLQFDNAETLTLENLKNNTVTIGKTVCKFTDGGIFNAAGTAVTVNASTEKFTADSKVVTIDAGLTSGATITGNSKANKISFGDGENVFVWTGGNDTLTNFGDDDLINVTGAISDGTVTKGNSVLTVGKNKITVKDSSQIEFRDSSGTKIFSAGIFTDEDELSATLTTSTANFDASKTTFTAVTGNAKNNKLTSNATGMTLTGGKGNDTFVTSGGSDFITDYGTGSDKISLGSALKDFSVTGKDISLDLAKGSVTIQNGAGKKISLVSGGKTTANIFTANGIFNAAGTAVTVNASTEKFTADSKVVTIDAGLTSGATITGNSKANKISFGDGENIFVWTGGNDTLENFGSDDLLSITGAISDGTVSKGNSVLTVGKNKITVKNSSAVNFTDSSGTKIFSAGIFTDEDETSVTLTSATKDFDASKTTFTSITGNAKANKLTSNATGMTLTGGKGNDSLWGGDGSDTFIYTANTGTDKILSFGNDDLLEILNANGTKGSFTKAAFASNNLTLTVKGGGKIVFGGVTSASTFNINGDTYHVSGKTIVK